MKKEQTERVIKNIQISEVLHSKVKKFATQNGMTVSGLTSRALIEYLDKREKNFYLNIYAAHN